MWYTYFFHMTYMCIGAFGSSQNQGHRLILLMHLSFIIYMYILLFQLMELCNATQWMSFYDVLYGLVSQMQLLCKERIYMKLYAIY